MLFHLMSHQAVAAAVDGRILIAYFGSCLIVFVIGRATGAWLFRLDGTAQSVFALGGIFSNIVLRDCRSRKSRWASPRCRWWRCCWYSTH